MSDEKDTIAELKAAVKGLRGDLAESRAAMEAVTSAAGGGTAAEGSGGPAVAVDAATIARSEDYESAVGGRPPRNIGVKVGKPEKFDGRRGGIRFRVWRRSLENYFAVVGVGTEDSDLQKMLLVSFLSGVALD